MLPDRCLKVLKSAQLFVQDPAGEAHEALYQSLTEFGGKKGWQMKDEGRKASRRNIWRVATKLEIERRERRGTGPWHSFLDNHACWQDKIKRRHCMIERQVGTYRSFRQSLGSDVRRWQDD